MAKQKKTCCRSSPRCASCPVLMARVPSASPPRSAGLASLFAEIYGSGRAVLPASVTDALNGLDQARRPLRLALGVRRDPESMVPDSEFTADCSAS